MQDQMLSWPIAREVALSWKVKKRQSTRCVVKSTPDTLNAFQLFLGESDV